MSGFRLDFGGSTGLCKPCPILPSDRTDAVKRASAAAPNGPEPSRSGKTVRDTDLPPERVSAHKVLLQMAKNNDGLAIRAHIAEYAVSPTYGNSIGQTPLHVAAVWNSTIAGAALIDHNANVNARNDMGAATPLHMAASRGRREFVELLLDRGADPTLGLSNGTIPAEMVSVDKGLANLLMAAAENWKGGGAAAAVSPNEATPSAPEMAPGARITLTALEKMPELNGLNGTVLPEEKQVAARADGRIAVELDGGRQLKVRAKNAILLTDEFRPSSNKAEVSGMSV